MTLLFSLQCYCFCFCLFICKVDVDLQNEIVLTDNNYSHVNRYVDASPFVTIFFHPTKDLLTLVAQRLEQNIATTDQGVTPETFLQKFNATS